MILVYGVLLGSLCVYGGSILWFHSYFSLEAVDKVFFLKILIITMCSWLPTHLIKRSVDALDPSAAQKIK
jgi:hypothetical protein